MISEQKRIYLALAALEALKLVQAEPTLQSVLKASPLAATVDEVSVLLGIDRDVVGAAMENLEEMGLVS